MNLREYENHLKKTKCIHKRLAMTVMCLNEEAAKFGVIYKCNLRCLKFFFYPELQPAKGESLHIEF